MSKFDLKAVKHIIWDWNGTLLDDLDLCINIINPMLVKRGLDTVTKDQYLDVFNFPVRDYYLALGFDFDQEPFETVSTEFITGYETGRPGCQLFSASVETLSALHKMGFSQSILSASKKSYLDKAVVDYGIKLYFNNVSGLDNHHAAGKLGLAQAYMSQNHSDSSSVIMVGDTLHDAEIAKQLDIQAFLIPNGHHSRSRLSETEGIVIDCLPDFLDLFK
jgi:phosphoglycolate phosphatase